MFLFYYSIKLLAKIYYTYYFVRFKYFSNLKKGDFFKIYSDIISVQKNIKIDKNKVYLLSRLINKKNTLSKVLKNELEKNIWYKINNFVSLFELEKNNSNIINYKELLNSNKFIYNLLKPSYLLNI